MKQTCTSKEGRNSNPLRQKTKRKDDDGPKIFKSNGMIRMKLQTFQNNRPSLCCMCNKKNCLNNQQSTNAAWKESKSDFFATRMGHENATKDIITHEIKQTKSLINSRPFRHPNYNCMLKQK